jgi:plasmid stability protein
MATPKRATVYFEPDVHRALRLRAAANDRSISDMVNDAVKASLAQDAEDLEAFDRRRKERSVSFEGFVRSLKRRGRL